MRFLAVFLLLAPWGLSSCNSECERYALRCEGGQIQECEQKKYLGGSGKLYQDPTEHTDWETMTLCPEGSACDPESFRCMSSEPISECEDLPNQTGYTCIGNSEAKCIEGHWDMTPGRVGGPFENDYGQCPEDYVCLVLTENPSLEVTKHVTDELSVVCALGGEPVQHCEGSEAETYLCLDDDTRAQCHQGYQIEDVECACMHFEDGGACCANSVHADFGCP